ncbi:MAG: hypothetical protein ACOCY1_01290 [Halovenus sp.]
MFEIHTTDPARLKRIVVAGSGGLAVGLLLVALNLLAPLLTGSGFEAGNVVFGLFGIVVVVLATHPTYQAAVKLDEDS